MFKCQECGRKFRTVKAAYRASLHGCPGCGGVDVDLDESPRPVKAPARKAPPQPSDGYHGEERDPLRPHVTRTSFGSEDEARVYASRFLTPGGSKPRPGILSVEVIYPNAVGDTVVVEVACR